MSHTTFSHQRLIAILGMLGSEHDGERAAAALQATKMVRDAGPDETMQAVTVGIEVGNEIWMGQFRGNQVGYFPKP